MSSNQNAVRNVTTSANRLIAILDKMQAYQSHSKTQKVIQEIFSLADEKMVGVYLGRIFTLANQVYSEVSSIHNHEPELHLAWMNKIYNGLSSLSVNGNVNEMKSSYSPEVRVQLQACDYELRKSCPEPLFELEKLTEIYDAISSIIEELQNDTVLDASLKNFIIDRLTIIQDIIANGKSFGYSQLIFSTESAFGGLVLRVDGNDEFKKFKNSSKAFSDTVDTLSRLLTIIESCKYVKYFAIEGGKILQQLLQ